MILNWIPAEEILALSISIGACGEPVSTEYLVMPETFGRMELQVEHAPRCYREEDREEAWPIDGEIVPIQPQQDVVPPQPPTLLSSGTGGTGGTSGTSLASLAASMQAGTWAELTNMSGFNGGAVLVPPAGGSLLEYTNRGSWNPLNQTAMVLGGSHSGASFNCNETRFVKYTDSTNSWTNTLPNPCPNFDNAFGGGIGHAYNHDTIDPATGDFYHRQYYSGRVVVFRHATQSWSQIASIPAGSFQVAGALEFFPERNSLVFLDGDWGLWEYTIANGRWTQRASTIGGGMTPQLAVGSYHNISQYTALCRCVLTGGGGGSRALYKYDANGTITRVADAPMDLDIPQAGSGSIITVDPSSGRLLSWDDTGTAYEYNPATNVWRATGRNAPFAPTGSGGISQAVAVPVSTHGVVMFVVHYGSASKVYVYKHSTS